MISMSQMNAWGISSDTVLTASVLIKSGTCAFRFYLVVFHCTDGVTMFLQDDHACAEQRIMTEVVLWQRLSFLIIVIDTFYKPVGFMTLSCLWQTVVNGWTVWFDFIGDCVNIQWKTTTHNLNTHVPDLIKTDAIKTVSLETLHAVYCTP